jgi:MFS family permease
MNAIARGWVASSYILDAAIGLVPLGRWVNMRDRKNVFVWGMVAFTLGSIASARSASTGSPIAALVRESRGRASDQ